MGATQAGAALPAEVEAAVAAGVADEMAPPVGRRGGLGGPASPGRSAQGALAWPSWPIAGRARPDRVFLAVRPRSARRPRLSLAPAASPWPPRPPAGALERRLKSSSSTGRLGRGGLVRPGMGRGRIPWGSPLLFRPSKQSPGTARRLSRPPPKSASSTIALEGFGKDYDDLFFGYIYSHNTSDRP
jgi:hypothetical protein